MGKPMTTPTDKREQHAYGSDVLLPGPKLEFTAATPTDTRAEGEAVSLHDRANYLDDVFKYSSDPMCAFAGQAMREAADLIVSLSAQLAEAQGYATRLATCLWEEHWKQDAPEWRPLPDLIGVLTQIDNACAGLVRPDKQHTAAMGTET